MILIRFPSTTVSNNETFQGPRIKSFPYIYVRALERRTHTRAMKKRYRQDRKIEIVFPKMVNSIELRKDIRRLPRTRNLHAPFRYSWMKRAV